MAHLISFVTDRFDPAKETPNPINPIPGEALLLWLWDRLQVLGFVASLPDTEDWGWYVYVQADRDAPRYLIGASGEVESGADLRWVIQIHKVRSLWDKIFGRNKLPPNDGLSEAVGQLVRSETDFRNVSVEKEG